MSLPPGPSRPMLAQMAGWVMRPDAFLATCHRRYGDCFTVRLLGFGEGGEVDDGAVEALDLGGDR